MSDQEKNKLAMYESLISYLGENRDIISNVRSLPYTVTKLRKVIDNIKIKEKELSSDILEKTILASNAKEQLIFTMIPVAAALFAFARQSNNVALKEKTRCTQSFYLRLKDRELLNHAEGLLVIAERNSADLKKFKLSNKNIHELKQRIENFKLSLEDKISSFISSDMVMYMNGLFNDADKLCSNMDSFIELLNDEYTEFYDEYLLMRTLEYHDQNSELMEMEEEGELEN